jgi:tight adherence protein C
VGDPTLAGFLAAVCAGLGMLAIPMLREPGVERLVADRPGSDPPTRRRGPVAALVEWVAVRVGPGIVRATSTGMREALDRRLDLAGRPGGLTVSRWLGLKGAIAILLGLWGLAFAALGGGLMLLLLGLGLGFLGPDVWLSRQGRLRQERIERELPDLLDILAITVRAGLGYRQALERVASSLPGPASEEMITALRQMDLGASRRVAFEALRARNGSDSLSMFVSAQLQAEELGVPLAEALNDIAADMRKAAHQNARKRAQQAAPRVSLIVTTLVVPGAMLLIVAAIVIGSGLLETGLFGG